MSIPLATLHYPDLNPVGSASLIGVGLTTLLVFLAIRRINPRFWRWAEQGAPGLLFLLSSTTPVSAVYLVIYVRWFPDAPDYIAGIVYAAFGFMFSLIHVRALGTGAFINGAAFGYAHGASLILAATSCLWLWVDWPRAVVFLAPQGAFLLCWIVVLAAMVRRRRRMLRAVRGKCHICAYDLRGSVASARCPECGAPIHRPLDVPPLTDARDFD